jgi:hypothetical protein
MQLNFDVTNLRELKFAASETESRLWICERVVAVATLESREACLLMTLHSQEKGCVGLVQAMQHILQYLREHFADVLSNGLNIGELSGLGVERRALARGLIGLDSLLQASVVQFTTDIQRGLQPLLLLAVGIESIFERLS